MEKLAEMVYTEPRGFHIPVAVKNCVCPDGKRRYVTLHGDADTFFSIPASVKFRGVSVTGYVTTRETDGERDLEFRPVQYGKNGRAFADAAKIDRALAIAELTYHHHSGNKSRGHRLNRRACSWLAWKGVKSERLNNDQRALYRALAAKYEGKL